MATLGQVFGKYTMVLRLAAGGQGEIYLARLEGAAGFEKLVVLKRLLPHLADDTNFTKMLVDEARIAAKIDHVNVCQVHELGQVSGAYYLAMEYLEGVPLSRILQHAAESYQQLDMRLCAAMLQQACEGLHHAHELKDADGELIGVVHRDMSPSNLFVTVDGYVKVLDFGVAKARGMESKTRTGTIKGKYEYMSPEQVLRKQLDRRSDVFSLGIVLFESLTVRRLFYRETEFEVFRAITDEPIPSLRARRPDVPAELVKVVEHALARDVNERFATARDLGRALIEATASLGPPLGAEAIGEYVRTQFSAEIERRREIIADNLARLGTAGARPASERADTVPLFPVESEPPPAPPASTAGFDDTAMSDVPAPEVRPESAPRRSRTRRAALWGVIVALALAAGATAAFVHRSQTSRQASTPVPTAPTPFKPDTVRPLGDPYVQALSRHQAEIEACFDTHLQERAQLLKLAMDIDDQGRVSRAWIEPREVTDTPLGQCLTDIAETIEVGARFGNKAVHIPLKAGKDKPGAK